LKDSAQTDFFIAKSPKIGMMDFYIRLATSYLIENSEDWNFSNLRYNITPAALSTSGGYFKHF